MKVSSVHPEIYQNQNKKSGNNGIIKGALAASLIRTAIIPTKLTNAIMRQDFARLTKSENQKIIEAAETAMNNIAGKTNNAKLIWIKDSPLSVKDLAKKTIKSAVTKGKLEPLPRIRPEMNALIKIKNEVFANFEKIENVSVKTMERLKVKKSIIEGFKEKIDFTKLVVSLGKAKKATAGEKAYALAKTNTIVVPKKGLATSAFHEMGHLVTANNKFLKNISKMKGSALLSLPVFYTALLTKRQKAEEGEKLSTLQKSTNFIKDNVGKLTMLAFTPVILTEALAANQGNKIAKNVLKESPKLLNRVKKANISNPISKLAIAGIMSFAAYKGVKIKDNAQAKLATKN